LIGISPGGWLAVPEEAVPRCAGPTTPRVKLVIDKSDTGQRTNFSCVQVWEPHPNVCVEAISAATKSSIATRAS
jgi:hypothetical protein